MARLHPYGRTAPSSRRRLRFLRVLIATERSCQLPQIGMLISPRKDKAMFASIRSFTGTAFRSILIPALIALAFAGLQPSASVEAQDVAPMHNCWTQWI